MRGTNPRRRGAALLVIASVAAITASAIGQRDGEPTRDDVVARFSSGVVRLEWGSDTTTTEVTGGRLSISTNDPRCANTLEAPCVYTINEVRLEAMNPFSIGGFDFDGVIVGTTGPGFNQVQTFLGATAVRGLPFWVIGNVGGQRFAFHGAEDPRSYLSVGDLQMGPATSSAVLFGTLVGVIEGRPSAIRFSVTADTPFENRPPYVDPTAPTVVATACVAEVPIDPGLTDVDDDVIARWAEIEGSASGA